jgi:hypothetical protein
VSEWVSECVSEKKWRLCVRAGACVCCKKDILLVCFSFLVLGFDEVLLSAAICCCCSAAASVVMWGCRKWHSLLER